MDELPQNPLKPGKKNHQGEGGGRPRKYKTPEEMQLKVDEYFKKHGRSPTLAGLSLHLDFSDEWQDLVDYTVRYDRRFAGVISRARRKIVDFLEKKAIRERGSAQGIIHRLKVMKYDVPQQIDINVKSLAGAMAEAVKSAKRPE